MSLLKNTFSNIDLINQSVPLHCWVFSAFWFQIIHFLPFLANFRHFPPFFTNIASIYTFLGNFFIKWLWVCSGVLSFKISLLAHIFYTHGQIVSICVKGCYILCHISSTIKIFFVHWPHLKIIFHYGPNLRFWPKSYVNFHFLV